MRTIAIVFALAVLGGTAPAAPYGRLSSAVLVFAAALVVLLAACLVSGWLSSELRTLMRMAGSGPAAVPAPVPASAFRPARVGRPRRVASAPQASAPRSRPSYPVPINESLPLATATAAGHYHAR